jgi:hypothetical protein
MSLTFLTPLGLLIGLVGVIPIAALVRTRRRAQRVREALHIDTPGGRSPAFAMGAIALFTLLLAVAVAQPAVRNTDQRRIRVDAQAYYVFDTSRSMLAAAGPDEPTRLDRAARMALRVRAELGEVPSGIANLTDRVLPNLFPTSDDEVFTATVEQSVGVDRPPPRSVDVVTTLFAAFDTMAGDNFFDPGTPKRVVIFFTDGESAPYDSTALAKILRHGTRIRFVVVRLWNANEKVHFKGREVPAYKVDPASERLTQEFASTVRGSVVDEGDVEGVVAAARSALGAGPIRESGTTLRVVPLARWFILASLVPLLGLLWRRNLV